MEIFFATGARVYEISNLKRQDIDLDNGIIRIFGKGSKERCVQIGNHDILELMKVYYQMNQEEIEQCGFFFVNQQGKRFSEQLIRRMIRKYSCQAGVFVHITPHMFRYTFASLCYAAGMQAKTVQTLMGHANYSTTIDIYTHIGEDFQKEEIDKFNSLTFDSDIEKTVH